MRRLGSDELLFHDLLLTVRSRGSSRIGGKIGGRMGKGRECCCCWWWNIGLKYSFCCCTMNDVKRADSLYIFSISTMPSRLLLLLLKLVLLLLFSVIQFDLVVAVAGSCWCNGGVLRSIFSSFMPLMHFFELTWLENEPECVKRRPQCLHMKGYKTTRYKFKYCDRIRANSSLREKERDRLQEGKNIWNCIITFSPEWMRRCSLRWCLNLNAFSHWLHLNRRSVSELSCVSIWRCSR